MVACGFLLCWGLCLALFKVYTFRLFVATAIMAIGLFFFPTHKFLSPDMETFVVIFIGGFCLTLDIIASVPYKPKVVEYVSPPSTGEQQSNSPIVQ